MRATQGSAVLFWMSSLINYCISIGVAYFVAAVSPNLAIACMAVASYGITITFFLGARSDWSLQYTSTPCPPTSTLSPRVLHVQGRTQ